MRRPSLISLTIEYFTRRGYTVRDDTDRDELQRPPRFDLIVSIRKEVHPVWIRDWNRTVGVNITINLDKASRSAGFSSPILVADKFSDHAKAYASRRGIILVTKSEMARRLR